MSWRTVQMIEDICLVGRCSLLGCLQYQWLPNLCMPCRFFFHIVSSQWIWHTPTHAWCCGAAQTTPRKWVRKREDGRLHLPHIRHLVAWIARGDWGRRKRIRITSVTFQQTWKCLETPSLLLVIFRTRSCCFHERTTLAQKKARKSVAPRVAQFWKFSACLIVDLLHSECVAKICIFFFCPLAMPL